MKWRRQWQWEGREREVMELISGQSMGGVATLCRGVKRRVVEWWGGRVVGWTVDITARRRVASHDPTQGQPLPVM